MTLVPSIVVVDVIRDVAAELEHIEPMARDAARLACTEIVERLQERVGLRVPRGRQPSEITAKIKALLIGESVTLTHPTDDRRAFDEFALRVSRSQTNLQQRNRTLRFTRVAIDGGFTITRLT